MSSMGQAGTDEADDFWCQVGWRGDLEDGAVGYRFQGDAFPRGTGLRLVEDDGVRTVQEFAGGIFEINRRGIEDGQVEVGTQEFQDAVGFQDQVLRARDALTESGHRFGKSSLLGTNPENFFGAGHQEARRIGVGGAALFFGDSPGVVGGGTVAGLAVGGTDAVAVLGDFGGGPVEFGQSGNEAGDDAGLANAAGVAADE